MRRRKKKKRQRKKRRQTTIYNSIFHSAVDKRKDLRHTLGAKLSLDPRSHPLLNSSFGLVNQTQF